MKKVSSSKVANGGNANGQKFQKKVGVSDVAKLALDQILESFETGLIPNLVSIGMFPKVNSPSAKWSLANRLLMLMHGTGDARTFKQWQAVDRCVKKGKKAFYILAPNIIKIRKETAINEGDVIVGSEKEAAVVQVLRGFRDLPVFRFEDTEGEPLVDHEFNEQNLPFLSRAKEWNLKVEAIPGNNGCYGYYSQNDDYIGLATPEESVFFHELAHAAHRRHLGELKAGQDPYQEIVAELSAAALCRMVGKECGGHLGNSYRYIAKYAEEIGKTPHGACMTVLKEVEAVLNLILNGDSKTVEPTSDEELVIAQAIAV